MKEIVNTVNKVFKKKEKNNIIKNPLKKYFLKMHI